MTLLSPTLTTLSTSESFLAIGSKRTLDASDKASSKVPIQTSTAGSKASSKRKSDSADSVHDATFSLLASLSSSSSSSSSLPSNTSASSSLKSKTHRAESKRSRSSTVPKSEHARKRDSPSSSKNDDSTSIACSSPHRSASSSSSTSSSSRDESPRTTRRGSDQVFDSAEALLQLAFAPSLSSRSSCSSISSSCSSSPSLSSASTSTESTVGFDSSLDGSAVDSSSSSSSLSDDGDEPTTHPKKARKSKSSLHVGAGSSSSSSKRSMRKKEKKVKTATVRVSTSSFNSTNSSPVSVAPASIFETLAPSVAISSSSASALSESQSASKMELDGTNAFLQSLQSMGTAHSLVRMTPYGPTSSEAAALSSMSPPAASSLHSSSSSFALQSTAPSSNPNPSMSFLQDQAQKFSKTPLTMHRPALRHVALAYFLQNRPQKADNPSSDASDSPDSPSALSAVPSISDAAVTASSVVTSRASGLAVVPLAPPLMLSSPLIQSPAAAAASAACPSPMQVLATSVASNQFDSPLQNFVYPSLCASTSFQAHPSAISPQQQKHQQVFQEQLLMKNQSQTMHDFSQPLLSSHSLPLLALHDSINPELPGGNLSVVYSPTTAMNRSQLLASFQQHQQQQQALALQQQMRQMQVQRAMQMFHNPTTATALAFPSSAVAFIPSSSLQSLHPLQPIGSGFVTASSDPSASCTMHMFHDAAHFFPQQNVMSYATQIPAFYSNQR